MFAYKIDVLESLKEEGYSTSRIRKERLLSEGTLQAIRRGEVVGIKSLEKICELLDMQPGNIIKYIENTQKKV